jgi:hypothetical protein
MRRDAPPQAPDPAPDRAHAEKLSFVPLAEGLSATLDQAAAENRLLAPLYALLDAILRNLLGTLERMLVDWREGRLPPPMPRRVSRPCPAPDREAKPRPRARGTSLFDALFPAGPAPRARPAPTPGPRPVALARREAPPRPPAHRPPPRAPRQAQATPIRVPLRPPRHARCRFSARAGAAPTHAPIVPLTK